MARDVALMTGVPVIIEPLEQALGALAGVVLMVDEEIEKLWLQQPERRLRNHVMNQWKISDHDLQ